MSSHAEVAVSCSSGEKNYFWCHSAPVQFIPGYFGSAQLVFGSFHSISFQLGVSFSILVSNIYLEYLDCLLFLSQATRK